MRFDDKQAKEEMNKAFGDMTSDQLWTLTKFAKHVRLRCRNNTAFNNYMTRMFDNTQFRQITKTRTDGSTYPGLQIIVDGVVAGADESEE